MFARLWAVKGNQEVGFPRLKKQKKGGEAEGHVLRRRVN